MRTLSAKLALLGIVLGGFVCTGDLPHLLERGSQAIDSAELTPAGSPPQFPPDATPGAPHETARQTPRAPHETTGQHTLAPGDEPEAPPRPPSMAGLRPGDTVPLPRLCREPVTIRSLRPGDRLLVRVGGELVAFDTIDSATGEAIEHRHLVLADGRVHVSAREAPRRIRISSTDGTISAGGRLRVEASAGGPTAAHMLGPIIAIGIDQGEPDEREH
jgi:hypothetical protein